MIFSFIIDNIHIIISFIGFLVLAINFNRIKAIKNPMMFFGLFFIFSALENAINPFTSNWMFILKPVSVFLYLYYHLKAYKAYDKELNEKPYVFSYSIIALLDVALILFFDKGYGAENQNTLDQEFSYSFYKTYGVIIEIGIMALNALILFIKLLMKRAKSNIKFPLAVFLATNVILIVILILRPSLDSEQFFNYYYISRYSNYAFLLFILIGILIQYQIIKLDRFNFKGIEKEANIFLENESYLKKDLTLKSTANLLKTNEKYFSQFLNKKYKTDFNSWINGLRIEKSKQFLLENPNLTIEAISEMSGFNHKTTFNRNFKKELGITPSEWVKSQNEVLKP